MIEPVEVLTTPDQLYACIPLQIPVTEIQKQMQPALQELTAALVAQGIPPTGPWFTHHFRRPTDTFDFEVCFPVATAVTPVGRIADGRWPATEVARTVYHGSYAQLPHAWGEFRAAIEAKGLKTREEFWEVYVVNPNDDPKPENWRTQLNWPLAK